MRRRGYAFDFCLETEYASSPARSFVWMIWLLPRRLRRFTKGRLFRERAVQPRQVAGMDAATIVNLFLQRLALAQLLLDLRLPLCGVAV